MEEEGNLEGREHDVPSGWLRLDPAKTGWRKTNSADFFDWKEESITEDVSYGKPTKVLPTPSI